MSKPVLFFDLDNTVLDFSWAEEHALLDALGEAGLSADAGILARYRDLNRQCWEMLEDGLLTREETLVRRFELLLREMGATYSAKRLCDRYERLLQRGHRFMPGAEETLRRLQGRARLFVASNGSADVQAARIQSAGLTRYFEDFFISEEIGENKPSQVYFAACFQRITGFDPACAMIVGDSLSSDIRGGINAGIRTCWYNPARLPARPEMLPDYQIADLRELPPLLDHIVWGGTDYA